MKASQPHTDHDRHKGKPAHSSYWKFAHRDWRFWLGLVAIFAAMFIYLMTEDFAWWPRSPSGQPSVQAGEK
jgi:hypothetical protein